MLLTVDVGNTNTVFAVFADEAPRPVATARASTRRDRMPDEWYAILAPVLGASGIASDDLTAMVVSSVVPSVTRYASSYECATRSGLTPAWQYFSNSPKARPMWKSFGKR